MSTSISKVLGTKIGRLTAISVSKRQGKNGQLYIHCQCECGKETEVRLSNFNSANTLSCGCNHKRANPSKKVQFVISNRPSDTKNVSAEKIHEGRIRRSIESIQEKRALEREFSLDIY